MTATIPAPTRRGAGRKADPALVQLQETLGHVFADRTLVETALTHVSSLATSSPRIASYQRLEFLGDHVLGLVVSDLLFRAFPEADEGELSKRLADLVRKETCASVARDIGLDAAVKVGGSGAAGEKLRRTVLADVCEAVIGAVYLDGGYQAAADVVTRLWRGRLAKPAAALRDAKTLLQEWAQARGLPTPTYRELARSGPHHRPRFEVAVDVVGLEAAKGEGGSKRAAEQAAAQAMLRREGVVGDGSQERSSHD